MTFRYFSFSRIVEPTHRWTSHPGHRRRNLKVSRCRWNQWLMLFLVSLSVRISVSVGRVQSNNVHTGNTMGLWLWVRFGFKRYSKWVHKTSPDCFECNFLHGVRSVCFTQRTDEGSRLLRAAKASSLAHLYRPNYWKKRAALNGSVNK